MRTLVNTLSALTFIIVLDVGATAQSCTSGTAVDSIHTETLTYKVYTQNCSLLSDEDGSYMYMGPWISALDPIGNLQVAVARYPVQITDFVPGPLGEISGMQNNNITSPMICEAWDRVFKVTKNDVETYRNIFNSGNIELQDIPESILQWPAYKNPHSDVALGREVDGIISSGSIRFHDNDSDGIYDPMRGDHPQLWGADEVLLWVTNDKGGSHLASGGKSLSWSMFNYSYVYNIDENELIRNTIFNYSVGISHNPADLQNAYYSLFSDYTSTNFVDKFGTIPESNAIYYFNDCWKYNNCTDGETNTSIALVKLLETPYHQTEPSSEDTQIGLTGTMNANIPFNMEGGITDTQFRNLMKNHWSDGRPLTEGGDGYNVLSNTDTVAFTNTDLHLNSTWATCGDSMVTGDIRVLMNAGPANIKKGTKNIFAYSVTILREAADPCDNIDSIKNALNIIQAHYDSYRGMSTSTSSPLKEIDLTMYPNPASGMVTIVKPLKPIADIGLLDLLGKVHKVTFQESNQNLTFDISKMHSGYYHVLVTYIDGARSINKLVIERY